MYFKCFISFTPSPQAHTVYQLLPHSKFLRGGIFYERTIVQLHHSKFTMKNSTSKCIELLFSKALMKFHWSLSKNFLAHFRGVRKYIFWSCTYHLYTHTYNYWLWFSFWNAILFIVVFSSSLFYCNQFYWSTSKCTCPIVQVHNLCLLRLLCLLSLLYL